YLTVAGKGYYDRQEVWDLLNLLRALYNPLDNLSLAAALRSPLFSLSDDALLALRLITGDDGAPIPLWDALNHSQRVSGEEAPLVQFARETLTDLRRKAGRITIAELLRLALEATGYLAILTGLPDGKRRRGNVEKLIDKAETSGRITLGAFTQYLKDMSENEVREGEATLESEGVVQLMTVHKSKGLEFPLVVLVDASYERRGGAGDLVDGLACKVYDAESSGMVETFAYRRAKTLAKLRETAERRRLFYVAATRAQDYLLVSGQVTYRENKGLTAAGWLDWLIKALDLGEIDPAAPLITEMLRIDFPAPLASVSERDEASPDWDVLPAANDMPMLSQPILLQPVRRSTNALARSLTATQIADLGGARHAASSEDRAHFAERWRRGVLHDAPERIETIQWEKATRVSEIVQRALRLPLPENDRELRELLRRYAWEEGIVEEGQSQRTVKDAYELLARVRRSDVFGWLDGASEVYRELPFVYQTEQRTIHGIIDLLLQGKDGRWRLIDTKTVTVAHDPSPKRLEDHARRYHMQVGVYAAAVRDLIGIAPITVIHYIRYAKTV
ncbi:MAG: 3'-5' exonuclease, partial [Chloroflexota bacterium]